MMRNKEMTMINSSDDQQLWASAPGEVGDMLVMYGEACTEEGATMTLEGFKNFVAWRKRVEKYFDNNEDSS